MVAATYDFTIEQGSTFRRVMIIGRRTTQTDVDGNVIIDPYDLTGCHLRMQVRQRYNSEVLLAATTKAGGIVVPSGTDGKVIVTFTDEATDSVEIKKALYDMELAYPSGDVVRVMQGTITFSRNITRGADAANIATGLGDVFDTDEDDIQIDTEVSDQPSTAF